MHTLPPVVALLVVGLAVSACAAAPQATITPSATDLPSVTTSAVTPTPAVDQTKAELASIGEAVFGSSWRPDANFAWPVTVGELGKRVGLCARAWAKDPEDPIMIDDVEKSQSSVQGPPRQVCVDEGSVQLVVVAKSLQDAIDAGIPDEALTAGAETLLAGGGKTGLVAVASQFTKRCAPFSTMLFPSAYAACQAPAKAMVPVLDRYNRLEADWAAAIA